MAKNRQQQIDEKAIRGRKAVGADNPSGQDHINPQRFVPETDDGANATQRKFNGIRIHDKDKETWGLSKVPRYEHD